MTSRDSLYDYKFSAGYFGKLPNFPDFIKYNAAIPEILVLDKWIQDGIVSGRKTGKNKIYYSETDTISSSRISSPVYFLSSFTKTEKILLGIIYPSNDKSRREFPFIIFLSIDKNKTAEIPAYLLPLFFCEWFDFCNLFFNEISSIVSAGKESLTGINLKLNPSALTFMQEKNFLENTMVSYNNFISECTEQVFRERVLDDFSGSKFLNLISNLVRSLSFLRYKPDSSLSFGIKIIMAENRDYKFYDIGFLIHIVMIISGKLTSLPGIFIKHGKKETALFIFFSSPTPQHFTNVFYDHEDNERMLNANADSNIEKSNSDFYQGNPEGNLKSLLDELNQTNSYTNEGNRRKFNF